MITITNGQRFPVEMTKKVMALLTETPVLEPEYIHRMYNGLTSVWEAAPKALPPPLKDNQLRRYNNGKNSCTGST